MSSLPLVFCRRYQVAEVDVSDTSVTIGYCDEAPSLDVINEISRAYLKPLLWEKISLEAWQHYCTEQGSVSAKVSFENDSVEHVAAGMPAVTDLMATDDEAPITQLLHAMLAKAILQGASDLHLETFQDSVSCRIRVDGELRVILQPPYDVAVRLMSRIKVMAELDIAQKRLPQDGRMSLQLADRDVDVRVATLPTQYGERAVLRLLDKKETPMRLYDLGFSREHVLQLQNLLKRPHGLILVTGPTGSGKTTTLYAALRELNYDTSNVMTIEDPVEYTLSGIAQTPVNPAIGLTFSKGLRALLRQDPDVIMVGEIRDEDTASIAVQASLTGHLVLSTLHTNTAVDALVRCRELGVPPYLLASSVAAVVSQRLLRQLCQVCMQQRLATQGERELLGCLTDEPIWVAEPVGCDVCQKSGYRGRFAVIELLTLDATWSEAIHREASSQELYALARKQSVSLTRAACSSVLNMRTSMQEWLRLMPEQEIMHEAL